MSYYTRREYCSELLQALATRNAAAKLLGFKIRIRENEWGRDIIPDQTTTIVRELSLVLGHRLEFVAELLRQALTPNNSPCVLFQR